MRPTSGILLTPALSDRSNNQSEGMLWKDVCQKKSDHLVASGSNASQASVDTMGCRQPPSSTAWLLQTQHEEFSLADGVIGVEPPMTCTSETHSKMATSRDLEKEIRSQTLCTRDICSRHLPPTFQPPEHEDERPDSPPESVKSPRLQNFVAQPTTIASRPRHLPQSASADKSSSFQLLPRQADKSETNSVSERSVVTGPSHQTRRLLPEGLKRSLDQQGSEVIQPQGSDNSDVPTESKRLNDSYFRGFCPSALSLCGGHCFCTRGRRNLPRLHVPRIRDVNKIDKYSRFIFPLLFILFNIGYWYSYLLPWTPWSS
ncbi:unnamed protein product [Protopolystoma xenopodis]|uniref:Neurotransmitter-gated ion-channel transmembrane domain-containing protein n=1 Tax=Protopolystoma xenopodis TaxID=117903 RepID=A0A3S5AX10_9PLAT|nr:unnamed protein product [Protopolystoma xenopodis]